jgi:hypothetical protein
MVQVLFVLFGLVLIGLGTFTHLRYRRLREEGVRADGVVVRHRRRTHSQGDGGSSVSYHAVLNFVDANGIPHEFEDPIAGRELAIGRSVPLLYLPGAPQTARIALDSSRRNQVLRPVVAGAVLIVVALVVLPLVHATGGSQP